MVDVVSEKNTKAIQIEACKAPKAFRQALMNKRDNAGWVHVSQGRSFI